MAPGFRYHVVTLIGIFLALGVGIAIGSAFVSGAIVERLSRQVADLRIQFKNQVASVQETNRQYADFAAIIGQRVTANALVGQRIALVQTGDYPDAVTKVRDAYQQAGATVTSVTVIDRAYPTRVQVALDSVFPKLAAAHPNLTRDAGAPFSVLADVLARGGQDSDLAALTEARLIKTEGDYTMPNDHVVLVGGASDPDEARADTVDIPLIAKLKQAKVDVMEVEPALAVASYVAALRQSDVTTVDNADTDIGRIGVVLALRSDRGTYGIKGGSQSTVPAPSADDLRRHTGL